MIQCLEYDSLIRDIFLVNLAGVKNWPLYDVIPRCTQPKDFGES